MQCFFATTGVPHARTTFELSQQVCSLVVPAFNEGDKVRGGQTQRAAQFASLNK
jgi:hypothetical protein